jgi:bacillithiol biosynthesis deacetylase BshB1
MIDALCVGAHPDDVEIGMGATVASLVAKGAVVWIVDLTNGEPTPRGSVESRAAEAAAAAEALGVAGRITLDLPNRELENTIEARVALAEVIREHRPRMLFAPYAHDAHPDHIAASAVATAARFHAKLTKTAMRGEPHYPPRLYQYFAMHLRTLPSPSFVTDCTDGMEAKMRALAAYESQFGGDTANDGLLDMVERMGRTWGDLIGRRYGEPFAAVETLAVSSPADLL